MKREFKKDGCRFMTEEYHGELLVFDLEVDDNIDTVEFSGITKVLIGKKKEETYPNVKRLIIGETVEDINIPNELFPNVKEVISYSDYFLNSDMLIRVTVDKRKSTKVLYNEPITWLLNTFCKHTDEVIDLHNVTRIAEYAFSGCRSSLIINDENIDMVQANAFEGSCSVSYHPEYGGLYMAGRMIIDVNKSTTEIIIPKNATYYFINHMPFNQSLYRTIQKVTVKNSNLFFKPSLGQYEYSRESTKYLIIDDDIHMDRDLLSGYILASHCLEKIEVTDENQEYSSYDGILYSKDGEELIACPPMKKGKIKIKEGTKRIAKVAFYSSAAERIEVPDSVLTIGKNAFFYCCSLTSVKLGNGIQEIPTECFMNAEALRHIIIPPNVKKIGARAFNEARCLAYITFSEGLEEIGYSAFCRTSLEELHLPASIKYIADVGPMNNIYSIYLKTDIFPKGIAKAITETVAFPGMLRCIEKDKKRPCMIKTPLRTIYFPKFLDIKSHQMLDELVDKSNRFPDDMFRFALADDEMAHGIAVLEYQNLHNEDAKIYLQEHLLPDITNCIRTGNEPKIIELLNLKLIDDSDMFTKIYDMLPDEMTAAKAYLMERCQDITTTNFSI